ALVIELSLHDALPISGSWLPADEHASRDPEPEFPAARRARRKRARRRRLSPRRGLLRPSTDDLPRGRPAAALGGGHRLLVRRVRSEEHTSELQSRFDL